MDIQAEKIELINLITEIETKGFEKNQGRPEIEKYMNQTDKIFANPVMVKRLEKSRQEIKDGKGVNISLDDIFTIPSPTSTTSQTPPL